MNFSESILPEDVIILVVYFVHPESLDAVLEFREIICQ